MATAIAYLALGANIGDRLENLRAAVRLIAGDAESRVLAVSPLYETAPAGVEDQPEFLNAVLKVETSLKPRELLSLCLSIEERLGRERTIRWGPRVIDIDILLHDNVTIDEVDLVIPHPRMSERAFVLVPLADIAPEVQVAPGVTAREAADAVGGEGVRLAEREWWSG